LPRARSRPSGCGRIGVLTNLAPDDPEEQARLAAFQQGLQELGWTDGRNVRIDYRWAAGDADSIRRDAAELVALVPDVIFANTTPIIVALQQATRAGHQSQDREGDWPQDTGIVLAARRRGDRVREGARQSWRDQPVQDSRPGPCMRGSRG
jgi:hypothetical protein